MLARLDVAFIQTIKMHSYLAIVRVCIFGENFHKFQCYFSVLVKTRLSKDFGLKCKTHKTIGKNGSWFIKVLKSAMLCTWETVILLKGLLTN